MELSKVHTSAVSFDVGRVSLTPSQIEIMRLIQSSLSENIPITKDSIIEAYISTLHPSGETIVRYLDYNWETGISKHVGKNVVVKEDWRTPQKATAWFKNNLASCIIKGKLLVLPIIEID